MKQIRIILLISITLACGRGYAQIGNHIPQYAAYNHSLNFQFDTAYSSWASISGSIISRKSLVNAYIYPPGSFAAPAGKITHIYVAGNSTKNWNNPYFTPAVVCMGHTAIHDFDTLQNSVTGVKDTAAAKALLYSLQRVVITDSIFCIVPGSPPQTFPYPSFMYPADNAGIWIKIKLDQPFMYNPAKSLVVGGDINATYGNESIGGYMGDVRITVDSSPNHAGGANYILKHKHSLLLFRDTTTGKTRGLTLQTEYMDLGFDIEPLSVSELYAQQHVHRAYPNPAADKLTIEGIERVGAYQVYDLMGRKALQGNTAGDAIPVNSLPPGMYLLRFMQGAVQQQIKFMKE